MATIGYTKLFNSILFSSIWSEDDKTRLVWITMLAMSNQFGIIESSVSGLANAARVSLDDCRKALDKFMAPDPDSRTHDNDGRRVEQVEGGWKLLNHAKYRDQMSVETRREYFRVQKQAYRKKINNANKGMAVREIINRNLEAEKAVG